MTVNFKAGLALIRPMAIAILAALLLRATLFQTFSIPSDSMWPTLQSGDHIIVTPYRGLPAGGGPERGDVIVFRGAGDDRNFYVKRVVAVPGEEIWIEGSNLFVNGRVLAEPYLPRDFDSGFMMPRNLQRGEYFVMGDNRTDSIDSRDRGPVSADRIVGRARLIFWSAGSGSSPFNEAIAAPGHETHSAVPLTVHWRRLFRQIR